MKTIAALVATTVVAAATLAGCGGDSEYCAAVKKDQSTLESFGQKRTDAAFAGYRSATRTIAKLAPTTIRKDWTALSTAIADVQAAQKAAGLKLEDVSVDAVAQLTPEQGESLNSSYTAFNSAVSKHGKRVAADVKSECSVTLQ
ncbi:hypothetical protein [Aeromicrobium stalagmiti]|uniref:hypothetical protein n=1 Tax=Aeromicrobium stalagmiti TaxID=2738988 RepID=UPI00156949F8|nr:hypothetical protein [Aeromicrobium stalagmiti]NRQ50586.1 hypothetical protein [Aeromicrobium stalagmiti]